MLAFWQGRISSSPSPNHTHTAVPDFAVSPVARPLRGPAGINSAMKRAMGNGMGNVRGTEPWVLSGGNEGCRLVSDERVMNHSIGDGIGDRPDTS